MDDDDVGERSSAVEVVEQVEDGDVDAVLLLPLASGFEESASATCPIHFRVLPELHAVRLRLLDGGREDRTSKRAPRADESDEAHWGTWRVRLGYLGAFALVTIPVYALMSWLWRTSNPSKGTAVDVLDGLSFVWLVLAVPILFNVLGVLSFRRSRTAASDDTPVTIPVCFRIVTRGTNVEAVRRSVAAVKETMTRSPLFPYTIEVVTDHEVPGVDGETVTVLRVPTSYETLRGARFKARALHFALDVSTISDSTWLFHLDEETHITPGVVSGIRDAILEEERSGELRIGQGTVLYHRDLLRHPFLTLADSIRTGDDLGRFRLQHRFGRTVFGLHGSFILVRNDVEKEAGFDVGPEGSVTEDAWWALLQMANGRRSRWVDGYCVEQSTRSFGDFVKQRRRWFVGLSLVCLHAPVRLWDRLTLLSSVGVWGISWLGWSVISLAALALHARLPSAVFVVGAASLAAYAALYVLGLEVNLDHRGLRWYARLPWHIAQLVLLPAFSLLEAVAVVYGVIRRDIDFHVVKK
jgi:egghead protein (zeste-white 4 protein)